MIIDNHIEIPGHSLWPCVCKIVQAGIARWVKDFKDGRIKIETVDDLKKLIEIDWNCSVRKSLNVFKIVFHMGDT